MRHIIRDTIAIILIFVTFMSCTKESEAPQQQAQFWHATFSLTAVGITSPIRVFGFDKDNHFVAENNSVAPSNISVVQSMVLPIGNDKMILLTGAGSKGDNALIATTMSPHMASFYDPMLRLTDSGGGLTEPVDYFYGKQIFDLVAGSTARIDIEIEHLCSKTEVKFINSVPNTIDHAEVYIENAGREIAFDGRVLSVGTTVRHNFVKDVNNNLLSSGEFLLFPSQNGVKPVVHAILYLANGDQKVFRKEIDYQFISNKILRFTFDLQDLEDNITLTTTIADWDGTNSETVRSDLKLRFTNGNALNYTKADITLQHNFSPSNSYPIHLYGLALTASSNQLELSLPLTNLEQGAYTITSVKLYDADGSFEALRTPVDFDMGFAINSIDANVLSRTQHEYQMVYEWLKVLDGNGGATYPTSAILNQMPTMSDTDMATLLPTLGFTSSVIDGQSRVTELNIPYVGTLASFIVTDDTRKLMKLNHVSLPTCQVRTISAENMPALATIVLSNNTISSIDLSDCSRLTSFSAGFTNNDKLALTSLDISSTSIKSLPSGLTNMQTLRWANCGLTDVSSLLTCPLLTLLDISYNNLTLYPDFATLTSLTVYNVSYNDIISCALSYMRRFGADNILPQRTGYNWWAP